MSISPEKPPLGLRGVALTNLAFTYANTLTTIVSAVLLVPLYLRHMTLATYGGWLATGSVLSVLALMDGGINIVLGQRLSHAAGSADRGTYVKTATAGVLISLGFAGLLGAGAFAIAGHLPGWVMASAEDQSGVATAFGWAAVGSMCAILQTPFIEMLHSMQKPRAIGVVQLCAGFASIAAVIAGLSAGWGVVALGVAAAVRSGVVLVSAAAIVVQEWRLMGYGTPAATWADLKVVTAATGPLFVTRFAGGLAGNAESAIVAVAINPELAAIFGLTQRVYAMCSLLVCPVYASAFSGVARLAAKADGASVKRVIGEVLEMVASASAILYGSAVALNPALVQVWVGSERFGGPVLSFLCAAAALVMVRLTALASLLNALGVIGQTAWVSLAEMIARLGLIYLLIPHLGVAALPLATVIGSGVVSGSALMYLMKRRTGGGIGLCARGFGVKWCAFVGGGVLSYFLSSEYSFPEFAGLALLTVSIFAGATFLFSPSLRRNVADVWTRVVGRGCAV